MSYLFFALKFLVVWGVKQKRAPLSGWENLRPAQCCVPRSRCRLGKVFFCCCLFFGGKIIPYWGCCESWHGTLGPPFPQLPKNTLPVYPETFRKYQHREPSFAPSGSRERFHYLERRPCRPVQARMRSLVVFAGGEDLAWGRMPGYPNRALAAGGGDPAWYDWSRLQVIWLV